MRGGVFEVGPHTRRSAGPRPRGHAHAARVLRRPGDPLPHQRTSHRPACDFAPEFARLNDDILFGEVWNREALLPLKLRSIATVSALIGKDIVDGSLAYYLQSARNNGVAKSEMAEILTHIAFYAGWPNAWAAFKMAKEA